MQDEDRLLEEIRRDPAVETGLHELLQLKSLRDHPGWQYQAERFKNYRKHVAQRIAQRLMIDVEVPAKEIAFARGYAQAIEDVFTYPERMEKDFERAAEKALERIREEGAVSSDPEEIPYT